MNYFRSNRFLNTLPDWETGEPVEGALENYLPRVHALLHRMDNPQARFDSVIVGGYKWQGDGELFAGGAIAGGGFSRGALYIAAFAHGARADMR